MAAEPLLTDQASFTAAQLGGGELDGSVEVIGVAGRAEVSEMEQYLADTVGYVQLRDLADAATTSPGDVVADRVRDVPTVAPSRRWIRA